MANISKGEQKIIDILKSESVPFLREKVFEDLHHGKYRFDFYLPTKNILIEFNGSQHYQFTSFFYKNKSEFTIAQERDRKKISYALAHSMPLYIIPYWELDNIKSISDILQNKFLASSKFHNDTIFRQHLKNVPTS